MQAQQAWWVPDALLGLFVWQLSLRGACLTSCLSWGRFSSSAHVFHTCTHMCSIHVRTGACSAQGPAWYWHERQRGVHQMDCPELKALEQVKGEEGKLGCCPWSAC